MRIKGVIKRAAAALFLVTSLLLSSLPAANAVVMPFGFYGVVAAPANTVAPVVSGGKSVGLTFSTTTGTWTGGPSFTYQWTRDGSNISSATASTYVMVAADIGTAIGVNVTGTNGGGTATASSSNTITGISWVASIQTVSITIGSTETSHTAPVSSVGSNAFVIFGGFTTSNSSNTAPDGEIARVELTSPTVVTAYRNTGTSGQTTTVTATVIDPGTDLVESVQQGTITAASATSNTAAISPAVDTTRSAVFWLGEITDSVSSTSSQWKGGVTLTSGSVVTFNKNSAGTNNTTAGFVVVQFKAQAISRVQRANTQFTATTTAQNDTTLSNAVVMANTIIAHGGTDSNSGSFAQNQNYFQVTSTTNVAAIRSGTTSQNITPKFAAVSFIPGVLKSCQRGAIVVDSVASNTAPISAVDTSKAFVSYTGQTASGSSPREVWAKAVLTSGTVVTATKDTAGATRSDVGFEVPEFN